MKKFMVLYMAPTTVMDEMMKNMSPEQKKEGMDSWNAWIEGHKSDLLDPGTPLGKNKRVTKDSITDTRNEVNGYSIVQAESHDEAAKIVQDSPNFEGGYIEVMEMVKM